MPSLNDLVAAEADLKRANAEIERLRAPWRAVDAIDWSYLDPLLGHSGHGKFWRAVLKEMRDALEQGAAK